MAMIRIFINSESWRLGLKLQALSIDEKNLKTVRIVVTKTEAESFIGGAWYIFGEKMKRFYSFLDDALYIGCLAEEDDLMYSFTAYFRLKNSPQPQTIKLPPPEKLAELGLAA